MDSDAVEPVDIVGQFESKLFGSVKVTAVNKLGLDQLEGGLGDGVVQRSSFEAQRTVDTESIKEFVDESVVKLTASVAMKDLNPG